MVFVGGGFPFGDVIHLETVLAECFIDFVAYLEGGKGDAGADAGYHFFALCAIAGTHLVECVAEDVIHRAAPSGMNSGYHGILPVLEQDGNAVCRRDADAAARFTGYQCINALQHGVAFFCCCMQISSVNDKCLCPVGLKRDDQFLGALGQGRTYYFLVAAYSFGFVSRVRCTVEGGIVTLAASTVAGGYKTRNAGI